GDLRVRRPDGRVPELWCDRGGRGLRGLGLVDVYERAVVGAQIPRLAVRGTEPGPWAIPAERGDGHLRGAHSLVSRQLRAAGGADRKPVRGQRLSHAGG